MSLGSLTSDPAQKSSCFVRFGVRSSHVLKGSSTIALEIALRIRDNSSGFENSPLPDTYGCAGAGAAATRLLLELVLFCGPGWCCFVEGQDVFATARPPYQSVLNECLTPLIGLVRTDWHC